MPIERCSRCERWFDLDWDHIEYLDNEPVCDSCLTDDELKKIDATPEGPHTINSPGLANSEDRSADETLS